MDHSRALVEQNRLLGELIRTADPGTPVPTCPDWTLRHLVTHVGRGDRWGAMIVTERADSYLDIRSVPEGKPPADAALVPEWLRAGVALLVDAATACETAVWTFTGPQPASWWVRRRLHETVVHRVDAALALGAPVELDPAMAADGVSEWLSLLSTRPVTPLPGEVTLHLHATDEGLGTAGEWMIRGGDAGIVWEHGHGKGTAAVRGSAADLLLATMRRIPADDARLEVLGDTAVFDTWLERTAF